MILQKYLETKLIISNIALVLIPGLVTLATCQPVSIGNWSWISGSNVINQAGKYGMMFLMPGGRMGHSVVLDSSSQSVYLFAGYGFGADATTDSYLNDFWKFDLKTKIWAWISGSDQVGRPGNYGNLGAGNSGTHPGARNEHSMVIDEISQIIYLFAGDGFAATAQPTSGMLNDLWTFDLKSKIWTWIAGSNTLDNGPVYLGLICPGGRFGASLVFDPWSRTLIAFGGFGVASASTRGLLNDFWSFDVTLKTWKFLSATSTVNQVGSYVNPVRPGARFRHSMAIDSINQLIYLYGGNGYASTSTQGSLNDLWVYDITTKIWGWLSGASTINSLGKYEAKGQPNVVNLPGSRFAPVLIFDSEANALHLFFGYGYATSLVVGQLNDFWSFDIKSGNWAWLSGTNQINDSGIYISRDPVLLIPRSRFYHAAVFEAMSRTIITFAGDGDLNRAAYLNDVWQVSIRKSPPAAPLPSTTVPSCPIGSLRSGFICVPSTTTKTTSAAISISISVIPRLSTQSGCPTGSLLSGAICVPLTITKTSVAISPSSAIALSSVTAISSPKACSTGSALSGSVCVPGTKSPTTSKIAWSSISSGPGIIRSSTKGMTNLNGWQSRTLKESIAFSTQNLLNSPSTTLNHLNMHPTTSSTNQNSGGADTSVNPLSLQTIVIIASCATIGILLIAGIYSFYRRSRRLANSNILSSGTLTDDITLETMNAAPGNSYKHETLYGKADTVYSVNSASPEATEYSVASIPNFDDFVNQQQKLTPHYSKPVFKTPSRSGEPSNKNGYSPNTTRPLPQQASGRHVADKTYYETVHFTDKTNYSHQKVNYYASRSVNQVPHNDDGQRNSTFSSPQMGQHPLHSRTTSSSKLMVPSSFAAKNGSRSNLLSKSNDSLK